MTILEPIRRTRDALYEKMESEGIPTNILDECCQGRTDEHQDCIMDEQSLDEFDIPSLWDSFIKACDAVGRAEKTAYKQAMAAR